MMIIVSVALFLLSASAFVCAWVDSGSLNLWFAVELIAAVVFALAALAVPHIEWGD